MAALTIRELLIWLVVLGIVQAALLLVIALLLTLTHNGRN